MTDTTDLPYRPCVGIMLFNDDGNVFAAQRIDRDMDCWQMPQGGIDKGEQPQDAVMRELYEETGIRNAEIIDSTPDWLTYDLPAHLIGKTWNGKYRGQKQKWYLLHFRGNDSEVNLHIDKPEFTAWQWIPPEQLPAQIVAFKRDVYTSVCDQFAPKIREYCFNAQ